MKIMSECTTEELEQEIAKRKEDQDTWIDSETGLEWQTGAGDKMNWEKATEYAKDLNLNGKGWRLPTVKELLTLVDYSKYDTCIKTKELVCVSSYYWSSTTHASYTSYAWGVNFSSGLVYDSNRTNSSYVRCVRGGSESIIF